MKNLFGYFTNGLVLSLTIGLIIMMRKYGGEFRLAYEEATKYGGKVILGDRPTHITKRRMLAKMSLWKYLFHPDSVPIRFFKTAKDELDIANIYIEQLSRKFPNYMEIFIYERDRYMSAKILKVAPEHNSVVAIVGRGHLTGILKNWKQPVDMKQLLDTGKYIHLRLARHSVPSGP